MYGISYFVMIYMFLFISKDEIKILNLLLDQAMFCLLIQYVSVSKSVFKALHKTPLLVHSYKF